MNSTKKNRGGRPPSPNPKRVHVSVKLTEAEHLEAMRVAQRDGTSVSEVIRRPLELRALAEASAAPFGSMSLCSSPKVMA